MRIIPSPVDLINAVSKAISKIRLKEVHPVTFHDEVKQMYSWVNVAERTEKVWFVSSPGSVLIVFTSISPPVCLDSARSTISSLTWKPHR